jgi:hypothetical protein
LVDSLVTNDRKAEAQQLEREGSGGLDGLVGQTVPVVVPTQSRPIETSLSLTTTHLISDGPRSIFSLSSLVPAAKACHMSKRRVGVWYSPSCAGPVRPEVMLPDRALCLPTFSQSLRDCQ